MFRHFLQSYGDHHHFTVAKWQTITYNRQRKIWSDPLAQAGERKI